MMKIFLNVPTLVVALLCVCSLRAGATSFVNTTNITIRDTNTAVPYPSPITVAGLTGTVSTVTVQLNNFSHGSPSDIEMLLVGPTGKKFVFLADAGGIHLVSGLTVVLADAGSSGVPSSSLTAGTFKPTDYGGGSGSFAAPAPTVAISDSAPPEGTATFAEQFAGTDPNGVWNLYIMDEVSGASGTVANGWILTITVVPPVATLTTLTSSLNPSFATAPTNTVVFNASVTSSSFPVTQGTVSFNDGAAPLATNVSLDAAGHAACTNSTLAEGRHVITASYNGTPNFAVSTSSGVTQIVETHTLMLTNVLVTPFRQFQFGFTGITMVTYTVLASTNLTNWSTLGPATENTPGQYRYIDAGISNFIRRFYRVKQP